MHFRSAPSKALIDWSSLRWVEIYRSKSSNYPFRMAISMAA